VDAEIDIMMPFYGDPDQFARAVDSVLAQRDTRWRLVIIDDRYPGDRHLAYLAGVSDPRVHYVLNDRNLGVSGNFQRAVDLAEAPWMVIMGCDDLLLPDYIARMRELLTRHADVDYVQPGVGVIDDDVRRILPLGDRVKALYRPRRTHELELAGPTLARSLLRGNWTYFPSICWRTETIRRHGFRADFEIVLDLALQLDIALTGGILLVDDVETFLYRRHRASASSTSAVDGTRFDEERAFFRDAAARTTQLGWASAARAARAHVSSRLNAATQLPAAIRVAGARGARPLLRHILTSGPVASA
jgi:GT2 family glycosyltransferase